MKKPFPVPVRANYSCAKCPAYCCTYSEIEVSDYDVARLAKHFGISAKTAAERFTKTDNKGTRMMRHRKDRIFDSACMMLDQEKRRCSVYDARPGTCRKYPETSRCGYYEFLKFERTQQGDEEFVALT